MNFLLIYLLFIVLFAIYYFVIPRLPSKNNLETEEFNTATNSKGFSKLLSQKMGIYCDKDIDKTAIVPTTLCDVLINKTPNISNTLSIIQGSRKITANQKIADNIVIDLNFKLEFGINPTKTNPGWSNILRFTSKPGGNNSEYGNRVLGIWLTPNTYGLHISMDTKTRINQGIFQTKIPLRQNQWNNVVIQVINNTMTILINGKESNRFTLVGNRDVLTTQLFVSDVFHPATEGSIRNLRLTSL